jgi:hypothetical protein
VQQDGSQEEDRRVEVEDRGDERDEDERDREDRPRADREPREQRAGSREEAVLLRDHADEQQARDEDERRPDLAGG